MERKERIGDLELGIVATGRESETTNLRQVSNLQMYDLVWIICIYSYVFEI